MAGPLEGLRKVLELERQKKFADAAVIGGLDTYLLRFLQDNEIENSHELSRIVQSLPPGGYRALHRIQRQRVVDELLRVAANGSVATGEDEPVPRQPVTPVKFLEFPKRKAQPKTTARTAPAQLVGTVDSPVRVLGLRRGEEEKLAQMRRPVRTVRDLLYHFPTRYHDYSEMRPIAHLQFGEEQTVVGKVTQVKAGMITRYKRGTEAFISDGTGSIRVIWFGQTYRARQVPLGKTVALSGKVGAYRGRIQLENPEVEELDDDALKNRRLVPVYPSTEGLPQMSIRRLTKQAIEAFADRLEDPLPEGVMNSARLLPIGKAMRQFHFPDSLEASEEARRRFAFEELLYIEIGVVSRRREITRDANAPVLSLPPGTLSGYAESLPFQLTAAQRRAIEDVLADIGDKTPMTRLLEGDVGSGKTVVAAAALLAAVNSGYQGAIMAPTEILAEQHFRTFTSILNPKAPAPSSVDGPWFEQHGPGFVSLDTGYLARPVNVALLTGSLKASEKQAAQDAIARGEVDIAIGTHALVQQGVSFNRLGIAVIDEQHRFGVEQRAALREKGASPHVLVMTATPIPRTLALTVYGDLDITVLDEMPPGRPIVKTFRVLPYRRDEAFEFARKKIAEGRQAYIICPLVEESESIEAKAAVQEYERLRNDVYPDLRLGLLHGRMTPSEKDSTMRAFRDNEIDILVSTAVVEVGVDVPNATVILIEGADRFGLSQLHQFRGRVRRSSEQGYCFLLSENPSPESEERLVAMETMDNGFELAEKDMELRGPGEYFGTRQSGMPDLRVAKLTDVELIEQTRAEATRLLDGDPDLARPEHASLNREVKKVWGRLTSDVS